MKKLFAIATTILSLTLIATSCSKKEDSQTAQTTTADSSAQPRDEAMLQTAAMKVVATNPDASVEVTDGVAHLKGFFSTPQQKEQTIASLKSIDGIKDVMDMTTMQKSSPDGIPAMDPANLEKVSAALKNFPSAKAEVINGEITITGNVSATQATKIKESVEALNVGKVNYNYVVK